MKNITPTILSVTLMAAVTFLPGCSSNTLVQLKGSPGATVRGHYHGPHVDSDFSGNAQFRMHFRGDAIEHLEFLKGNPQDTVSLTIRQGRQTRVEATSTPGTTGIRVQRKPNWTTEILHQ